MVYHIPVLKVSFFKESISYVIDPLGSHNPSLLSPGVLDVSCDLVPVTSDVICGLPHYLMKMFRSILEAYCSVPKKNYRAPC